MFTILKLASKNLISSPIRFFFTIVGMIAAVSILSWTLASYDAVIIGQKEPDFENILGQYDCFLLTEKQTNTQKINQELTELQELKQVKLLDLFCTVEVSLRKAVPARGPGQASEASKETMAKEQGKVPVAAPPLKGLPVGFRYIVGTNAKLPPKKLLQGEWLQESETNTDSNDFIACILAENLVKRLRLKLGEEFAVGSFAGSFKMRLVGIVENSEEVRQFAFFPELNEKYYTPVLNEIFVSWEDAEKIAGGKLNSNFAAISLQNEQKEKILSEINRKSSFFSLNLNYLQKSDLSSSSQNRLKMQCWTAGSLSFILSFLITFVSMSMGTEARIRRYALLRSIALSRKQLLALQLLESLLYAIIAWGGAILTTKIILKYFASAAIFRNPMRFGGASKLIGPWTIFWTLVCSVLSALSAALFPAWRATKIDVLSAIRPLPSIESKKVPLFLIFPALFLLILQVFIVSKAGINELLRIKLYSFVGSPATMLAFVLLIPLFLLFCQKLLLKPIAKIFLLPAEFLHSQLRSNFWRSCGTVMALSIGLGFYMMLVIWSASLLKPFLPGDWMPDLFITIVPGGIQADDVNKIQKLSGVKDERCLPVVVEQCRLANDLTGSRDIKNIVRQDNITLMGLSVAEAFAGQNALLPFNFITDKDTALEKLNTDENYCLVPSFFTEVAGLKLGDKIGFVSPDDENKLVEFEIAGIIELPGWHWFSKFSGTRRNFGRTAAILFCQENRMREEFNLHRTNYFWADIDENFNAKEFKKEIQSIAEMQRGQSFHVTGKGEASIRDETVMLTEKSFLHHSVLSRTDQIVSGMLKMPLLLLCIMSLSVANTAFASVRARKGEIAIMRSVGLSRAGLLRLLLAEAVLTGIVVSLFSLAYGIFSGLCSAKMAGFISFFGGMGWHFVLPWLELLKGAVATLIICFIAALIPTLIIIKNTPLQLLQVRD